MIRVPLITLVANVLLWTVQSQINHYIAPWQMSGFVGGLAVTFAALRMGGREGARAVALTGLWFDAATPVPFGLHAFLFLLCHLVIYGVRGRVAREETLVGLIIAAITNLALYLALSVALLYRSPSPLDLSGRLIADSLISFCVLFLIGPWFFAFAEHLLAFAGVSLRREQRGIV
jgi:hypothetical protein